MQECKSLLLPSFRRRELSHKLLNVHAATGGLKDADSFARDDDSVPARGRSHLHDAVKHSLKGSLELANAHRSAVVVVLLHLRAQQLASLIGLGFPVKSHSNLLVAASSPLHKVPKVGNLSQLFAVVVLSVDGQIASLLAGASPNDRILVHLNESQHGILSLKALGIGSSLRCFIVGVLKLLSLNLQLHAVTRNLRLVVRLNGLLQFGKDLLHSHAFSLVLNILLHKNTPPCAQRRVLFCVGGKFRPHQKAGNILFTVQALKECQPFDVDLAGFPARPTV